MRLVPLIFGLLLIIGLMFWELHEFFVTNKGLLYFGSEPKRIVYVLLLGLAGGLVALGISRLSPACARKLKSVALAAFGGTLVVAVGFFGFLLYLFAAAPLRQAERLWWWLAAAFFSLAIATIVVWMEFWQMRKPTQSGERYAMAITVFFRKKRAVKAVIGFAGLLAIIGAVALNWEHCFRLLLYSRPTRYDQQGFPQAIARADRLVFTQCFEGDRVQVVITNAAEVRDLASHLEFKPLVGTNFFYDTCLCLGFPGIDWYAGSKRLARTSVQHSRAIRWRGFSSARILGLKVLYGDAHLTKDSAIWVKAWLVKNGLDEEDASRQSGTNQPNSDVRTTNPDIMQGQARGRSQQGALP